MLIKLSCDQGAGNSFLGGLAAGLALTNGDVFEGKYETKTP